MNLREKRKRFGKHAIIAICTLLLLCAMPMTGAAAQPKATVANEVTITLDGETIVLADPVRKLNDRLFLPVAHLANMFDAKVDWDTANEEATIQTSHGDTIVLGNGVPVVYFNKARYMLDAVPFLMDGRMYIPLRHVAELLHLSVHWNDEEQTAELETVSLATVTEEFGLAEIIEQHGGSKPELLKRNGLESEDAIKAGVSLRVVLPSILKQEAAPFTEDDLTLLAKITQVEAGYESYQGQLAVANVILNRVKDSRFPGTIRDVIYSGKQFPPAHNGLLDKSVPNASVMRAAKDALNGKNNIEDAIYFFNPRVSKGAFWSSLKVIDTIGHHSFAK